MMTNTNPRDEDETTPQGAVEIDEEALDQAAGGIIIVNNTPAESFSLNFSGQKVAPQSLVGAGPGAGPHVVPEKKI